MKFYSVSTLINSYLTGSLDRDDNKLVIDGGYVRLWRHGECVFEITAADLLKGLLSELNMPWEEAEATVPVESEPGPIPFHNDPIT